MRILLGIAIAAVIFSSRVSAATIESFDSGVWSGGAYSSNQDGRFSHCAMSAPYKSGITVLFVITRDFQWSINFTNDAWKLDRGSKYDLTYWIDGYAAQQGKATAISDKLVSLPLADSQQLFERFRKGLKLTVVAAGQTFNFNLVDTSVALNRILGCAKRYAVASRYASNANPFVKRGGQKTAQDRASFRAEAAVFAANVLSQSGVGKFHLLDTGEIPPELNGFDAVWVVGEVIGTINVLPASIAARFDQIPSGLIAADAQACEGKFASGSSPTADGQIGTIFTACNETGGVWMVHYVAVKRKAGGFYVFAAATIGDNETAAKQTADGIRSAALQMLR